MLKKDIYDPDFGKLMIKVNARARHIIFYNRADGLYITVPAGVSEKEITQSLEKFRTKLLQQREKIKPVSHIDPDYRIDCELFKLELKQGTYERFLLRTDLNRTEIIYPPDTDFENPDLQQWIRKVIEESLRKQAVTFLPGRLKEISMKLNLPYEQVKINSSKGRWGSCSGKKHINLSYYLMLLPSHLVDYVLIHELCHTVEMNHSERFWALMDRYTNNRSLLLRKELRGYKTAIT